MILLQDSYERESLPDMSWKILDFLEPPVILLLSGDMGTGKTSFTREFARCLQIQETVQSPTFNLHHQYEGWYKGIRVILHHLDLYRLTSVDFIGDIDFTEWETHPFFALVEWPQKPQVHWEMLGVSVYEVALAFCPGMEESREFPDITASNCRTITLRKIK